MTESKISRLQSNNIPAIFSLPISNSGRSFHPTDEWTMVGSIQAFDLAVAGAFVRAGTKKHVIEDPKSEAHTVDGERRHANLPVEKACGELVSSVPRV